MGYLNYLDDIEGIDILEFLKSKILRVLRNSVLEVWNTKILGFHGI